MFRERYVAHRGLHNDIYPENSMGAFENAVHHGYAIELDVRLSKDKKLIVFHDKDLKRMCGCDLKVRDLTYSRLKAYGLKDSHEHIPLLSQVLKTVNGRVPLLIELKNCGFIGLERRTCRLLKSYRGQMAVQSFDPFKMLWFRLFARDIPRGQLISVHKKRIDLEYLARRICALEPVYSIIADPDFVSADIRMADMALIKKVKRRGRQLFVWTIRSIKELKCFERSADKVIFEDILP